MKGPSTAGAMLHPRIEDDRILDRYVVGHLSPEEVALFEEHLFECPDCLEQVEAAEELRRGLGAVVVEDAVHTVGVDEAAIPPVSKTPRRPPSPGWANHPALRLAASILATLGIAWLALTVFRQGQEIRSLRLAAHQSPPVAGALPQPMAGFLTVPLGLVRDSDPVGAVVPLRPRPGEPLLLSLELPAVDAGSYRLTVWDAAGESRWSAEDLGPNLYESLAVLIPPDYLSPGVYRIVVEPMPSVPSSGGSAETGSTLEVQFQVLASISEESF